MVEGTVESSEVTECCEAVFILSEAYCEDTLFWETAFALLHDCCLSPFIEAIYCVDLIADFQLISPREIVRTSTHWDHFVRCASHEPLKKIIIVVVVVVRVQVGVVMMMYLNSLASCRNSTLMVLSVRSLMVARDQMDATLVLTQSTCIPTSRLSSQSRLSSSRGNSTPS